MNTLHDQSKRFYSARHLACCLLLGWTVTLFSAPIAAADLEPGSRAIPGYLDYSYDKNSVLFNLNERYQQTVFFDTFYPFDPSLRYNNAEALVRYQLEHKPYSQDGVLMVALADLRKIYAPYFSYKVDPDKQGFAVEHHFFRKRIASGSGSRAPLVEYTKVVWQGSYSLASKAATASSATYAMTNDRSTIDRAAIAEPGRPAAVALDSPPAQRDGRIYVPLASFMKSLGKTITDDGASSGYLAVSHVGPTDVADDLFNPRYQGEYPNTPITAGRVQTMNGLLSGAITKGNLWNAFYFGDLTVYSGKVDANGKDIDKLVPVDRLLPYRLYIPKNYRADQPSRFSFVLHGSTGNENAPFERPNDHLKNQPTPLPGVVTVEDFADHYNYILLSPNGWTRNPRWGDGPGEQVMLYALDAVKKSYNIDAGKTFIFGNSAGGAGTMNFASRHASLFKAMAPTAPGTSKPLAADLKGPILDMPALISCNTADITVFYAGPPTSSCQTWYQQNVKDKLRQQTFVTVENGHHSYGPASVNQMTFDFFERVLDKTPASNVTAVRFAPGQALALVTRAGGTSKPQAISNVPVMRNGILTVVLDDLASIYGPADFKVYDVYAYNRTPSDLVTVKTIIFNRVAVNIKVGERFLRVGGMVHAGDTTDLKSTVPPGDPAIDPRELSIPAQNVEGKVYVPVVEFMQLFGKPVSVE